MIPFIKLSTVILVCLILSIQDLREFKVSWWIIAIADVIYLILQLIDHGLIIGELEISFWLFPIQALCMFLFYLLVRILSGNKFGWGDVLFSTFIGLSIKWNYLYLTMIISVICVDFYFFIIWKLKKISLRSIKVPFIPFMSAGFVSVYLLNFFMERF